MSEVVAVVRKAVVIGSGIVGVSVARELARKGIYVTVLDRDAGEPRGSTAFAPGFVGLYNDVPILTELARASAAIYEAAETGFSRVGGLEIATSDAGAAELTRRAGAARSAGLASSLLAPSELHPTVTDFVDTSQVVAAAYFPEDGAADVQVLTRALRNEALGAGARFLGGQDVTGIDHAANLVTVTTASGEVFTADDVVLAGGVWGPSLSSLTGLELPLFPVAHPYIYSSENAALGSGPFVRWPEHHVYARVHHDQLGIGSYDHVPAPVAQDGLIDGAGLPWPEEFDSVVTTAQRLLRSEAQFTPARRINGVFAMTPDNLPFLGPHPELGGVWVAQAIWVTHAAGSAAALVAAMINDMDLPSELAVNRFDGAHQESLRTSALRLYRDIYATDTI
ncbi:FAD-binding oxidoreductase [Arthrobacter sp. BF1]|uniref:NAD(P)/FAD-dependent oxidoreductase n=1 Tax=Arthrobacter sp. BF1 TaxID=2821145 RepID=UPI001C4F2B17|nr:FAD-binding oxidoreductase [Arthrobacter sp. BF1]